MENVERVEIYEFTVAKINLLKNINATNLKDLLIIANQTDTDWDWNRLDSALVALRSRMETKPLNFYLTSDDGKFNLEREGQKFLPKLTGDGGVSIDKSLVETSMESKRSSFDGTGKRYKHPCN